MATSATYVAPISPVPNAYRDLSRFICCIDVVDECIEVAHRRCMDGC
jgi:hypothetical protein